MEGISAELLTDTYYLNKMSSILKESHGIKDRISALCKIFKRIDYIYDKIINQLNIFDDNYVKDFVDKPTDTVNNYLDNIGKIFGIVRSFTINYGSNNNPVSNKDLNGTKKYITLNNKEFLIYLKLQIIKQHFSGTREEIAILYGEEQTSNTLSQLNLIYITREDDYHSEVNLYWQNANDFSTDFKYMFLNGLLSIESMGITYNHVINNIKSIIIFRSKCDIVSGEYGDFYSEDIPENARKVVG